MESLFITFGGIALVLVVAFIFRKKSGKGGGRPEKFDDNIKPR